MHTWICALLLSPVDRFGIAKAAEAASVVKPKLIWKIRRFETVEPKL